MGKLFELTILPYSKFLDHSNGEFVLMLMIPDIRYPDDTNDA